MKLVNFSADGRVSALNIPAAASVLRTARTALTEAAKSIVTWRFGCDLAVKESELMVFVNDFTDKLEIVQAFETCLASMDDDNKTEAREIEASTKRHKRYEKTKVTKWLIGQSVPKAVAQFAAQVIHREGSGIANLGFAPTGKV